jgi:hypothetical protein
MAICDDQGDPNPGGSPIAGPNIPCRPDSDSNIYDSPNPASADYIGRHPGTAFMEMQFYPPGWFFGNSPTQWTAALNIDTFQDNANSGQVNNPACLGAVGTPYVNFAFIQIDGKPFPAGSPSPLGPFVSTNANTLFMNPGDELIVTLRDTKHGFKVTVRDLTSDQTGFMVASAANGFAQVKWDPNGSDCAFATHNLPHDFHPAYSTSSEHTRVPGAAHTYNISFSDEIGHFEYCSSVASNGVCLSTGANDPPGLDDFGCLSASLAASFGLVPIGGCTASDVDFDGVPYRNDTWPGSFTNPYRDAQYHAQSVLFSSPLFFGREGDNRDEGDHEGEGGKHNYSRIAFEVDLPRIEGLTNPRCQRHLSNPADPSPGTGCVNPPVGADFYPIYTTRLDDGRCLWQLGGTHIPGTQLKFGGTSTAEYGPLQAVFYPAADGQPQYIYENFHRTLSFNPCPTFLDE